MPNPIKYNSSTETNALNVGNFWIGTGDVDKGPTSITGYYNGITPPADGYTIYVHKLNQGPSIRIASDDSELIEITNDIARASYTTITQCFNYYEGQSDKMVMGHSPNNCMTDNLVVNFDATTLISYPKNGNQWYDLSENNSDGTLINSPTFNSDNRFPGYINLDGSNDYINISSWDNSSDTYVVEMWARWRAGSSDMFMGFTTYDIWTSGGNLGFNTGAGDVYGISSTQVNNLGLVGTSEDNWHHYIFEFNRQVVNNKMYIDTVEQSLSKQVGNTNLTGNRSFASSFRIGTWNNSTGYNFNGDVAIFRMYNQALTQKEINFNYFGGNVEVDGDYVKIFRHYTSDGDMFSNNNDWAEAKNTNEGNPNAKKYSILSTLEKYKRDGKFTFKLNYPNEDITNIWSQTNNPVTDDGSGGVTGYTAISIEATNNSWGGLERRDSITQTFLDGSPNSSNWWYAVGARSNHPSYPTIPGANTGVTEVELWVKFK